MRNFHGNTKERYSKSTWPIKHAIKPKNLFEYSLNQIHYYIVIIGCQL